jgi:NADPH-dependent 2,4-dienoyl-CoA reductase/sulfur reductase-like enzyme
MERDMSDFEIGIMTFGEVSPDPATGRSPSPATRLAESVEQAHKQGRVAGENAIGGEARFAGSLGTQVVKVFDLVAARTGLRDHEAVAAGFAPHSATAIADDHKRYYPGATPISIRITGDTSDGRLLGAQLVGTRGAEISKRVDTYATALHHQMTVEAMSDLDLSYTPPLGSPWDAVQVATQAWSREVRSALPLSGAR